MRVHVSKGENAWTQNNIETFSNFLRQTSQTASTYHPPTKELYRAFLLETYAFSPRPNVPIGPMSSFFPAFFPLHLKVKFYKCSDNVLHM